MSLRLYHEQNISNLNIESTDEDNRTIANLTANWTIITDEILDVTDEMILWDTIYS